MVGVVLDSSKHYTACGYASSKAHYLSASILKLQLLAQQCLGRTLAKVLLLCGTSVQHESCPPDSTTPRVQSTAEVSLLAHHFGLELPRKLPAVLIETQLHTPARQQRSASRACSTCLGSLAAQHCRSLERHSLAEEKECIRARLSVSRRSPSMSKMTCVTACSCPPHIASSRVLCDGEAQTGAFARLSSIRSGSRGRPWTESRVP